MLFSLLLILPILVALGFYLFKHQEISFTELGIQFGVMVLVAGLSTCSIYHSNVDDYEALNGHVTGKFQDTVSCSHSYQCNCHQSCSGFGKNRSCHTVCSTCYRHSHDYDWVLKTTIGPIYIARVDEQGARMPSRFNYAKVNDPVTKLNSYENFIKAAPGTLLKHQGLMNKFKGKLPEYPLNVYDYHYLDRILVVNGTGYSPYWNREIARLNDRVAHKQANVVLVIAKNLPQEYAYALEQKWVGGKKNDVVVVLGTEDASIIKWAYIMTWSKNELFKVKLRNELLELNSIENLHDVFDTVEKNIEKLYVRRPMHDFEYLKSSITPTTTQWVVAMLIGLIISIGLSILFSHPEVHISITGRDKNGNKKNKYYY